MRFSSAVYIFFRSCGLVAAARSKWLRFTAYNNMKYVVGSLASGSLGSNRKCPNIPL